jgi:hypothetical protein
VKLVAEVETYLSRQFVKDDGYLKAWPTQTIESRRMEVENLRLIAKYRHPIGRPRRLDHLIVAVRCSSSQWRNRVGKL